MMRTFSTFLILILCATSGKSQTMFGHSNTGCIEFIQTGEENGPDPSVNSWILGYFSGRIRETNRELQIINELNIPLYDLLHKTCVNDPNLNLQEAADLVYLSIP
jgi:hypothetical protein